MSGRLAVPGVVTLKANRWGQLRGETVEGRDLAKALRDLLEECNLSTRDLAAKIHHSKTTISDNLSGRHRPDWEFVKALITACAGEDAQARLILVDRFRRLWEAADPAHATLITPDDPAESIESQPEDPGPDAIDATQEIPVLPPIGRRKTRRTAVLALLAVTVSVTLAMLFWPVDAVSEVRGCLTGVWILDKATSTGPDHGHVVSYHIKGGKALMTFNDDGSGNVKYHGLQIETAYSGDPPWAPILDGFEGVSTFRYTVNKDREDRTRISYEEIKNSVATGSEGVGISGTSAHRPPVWLTSSYVTCTRESLTLRAPDEGRTDSYIPDK